MLHLLQQYTKQGTKQKETKRFTSWSTVVTYNCLKKKRILGPQCF